MKNYLKKLLDRQKEIREKLGWKKYIIGILVCGYLTTIIGGIIIRIFPKELIFLIITQLIIVAFFILLTNKHLYEFTIKNDNSRYKRYKGSKGFTEISWSDVSD